MQDRPPSPIRVLVVDDQSIVREGLRAILAEDKSILVVGEASNGRQALQQVAALAPDLVLLDIRMPDMDGFAAIRGIKQQMPHAKVLMLTGYPDPQYLKQALEAGAAGYVLKDLSAHTLLHAVHAVAQGESLVDSALLSQLVKEWATRYTPLSPEEQGRLQLLDGQELQLLQLMARGLSNAAIARELGYSQGTIKNRVSALLAKLQVSDRAQAVYLATRGGIIT
ncbi:MAG: response regulator transcription factor [Chloroflexi bacterium]|nr:response regulator transcription factor [Chloroflexota bacterium]